jgi:hypothetical protein
MYIIFISQKILFKHSSRKLVQYFKITNIIEQRAIKIKMTQNIMRIIVDIENHFQILNHLTKIVSDCVELWKMMLLLIEICGELNGFF